MSADKKPYTKEDLQQITLRDHVRQRPSMYLGDTTINGLHFLASIPISQSFDCTPHGLSYVSLTLNADGSLAVNDDGPGFAVATHERASEELEREVSNLEVAMTHLGSPLGIQSPRFPRDRNSYYTATLAIANFLSKSFEVVVHHEGRSYRQTYRAGESMGPVEIGSSEQRGFSVTLEPDGDIFQVTELNVTRLRNWLQQMAFLHAGIRVRLEIESTAQVEEFCFEDGLVDYVRHQQTNRTPLYDQVTYFAGTTDEIEYEIAFQYAVETKEITHSFVNGIASYGFSTEPQNGGTHVKGFWSGLRSSLEEFQQEHASDFAIASTATDADYFDGLTSAISVRLANPQWENAMRSQLGNADVEIGIRNEVHKFFSRYWIDKPATAHIILEKVRNAVSTYQRPATYCGLADIHLANREAALKDVDDHTLIVLPGDYVMRLHRANGGYIQLRDGTRWELLPLFNPLDDEQGPEPDAHVLKRTLSAQQDHNFPKKGVVIGHNDANYLLVLLPSKHEPWWKYPEAAYSWAPETGELEKVLDSLRDCEPKLPIDCPRRW